MYRRLTASSIRLATLIVVVTGVCIAFSLIRWHSTYGLMAAILIVGSGWSLAAMRAMHHRLAYMLATPAMGVAGHLVLVVPMAFILGDHLWNLWFQPAAVLLMSAATFLGAAIMRRRVLAPGPKVRIGTVVGVTYVTAAIFPLVWGVAGMTMGPEVGMLICIFGVILSPFVATVTLPLSLLLAALCCSILRKIDPWRPAASGPITSDLTSQSRKHAALNTNVRCIHQSPRSLGRRVSTRQGWQV